MSKIKYRNRGDKLNSVIVIVAILQVFGLTISMFVGYWVRDIPELLVDVFKTFLTVLLLPAVTGLLGYMQNTGNNDLAMYNAHRISNLEQNPTYRGSDATPDPNIGVSETTTFQRRLSVTEPRLDFQDSGVDYNDPP